MGKAVDGTQDRVPLGPEAPPLEVALAGVEDEAEEPDVDAAEEVGPTDEVNAFKEPELLDTVLLGGELVALAELLEGPEVAEDDPFTGAVTVTSDPVEKYPQSLPAQEMP